MGRRASPASQDHDASASDLFPPRHDAFSALPVTRGPLRWTYDPRADRLTLSGETAPPVVLSLADLRGATLPDDFPITLARLSRAARRQTPARTILHGHTSDGRVDRWDVRLVTAILEDGRPTLLEGEAVPLDVPSSPTSVERLVGTLVASTRDAVYIKDFEGRYQYVNPAAALLLGSPAADLMGRTDHEALGAPHVFERGHPLAHDATDPLSYELHGIVIDRVRDFHVTRLVLRDDLGHAQAVATVIEDVTERNEAIIALREANAVLERTLREQTPANENATYTDPLTGLLNRNAFDATYETLLDQAITSGGTVHLLVLDLDELKTFNDHEGHERGDDLLRRFSRALRKNFRGDDHLFRRGGDEFLILARAPESDGRALRERVDRAVADVRRAGFPELTVSVGRACSPGDTLEPRGLLRLADQRMLRAKSASRAERTLAAYDHTQNSGQSDVIWQALRTTLSLLITDGELTHAGWTALLTAAVAAVPGAQGGSLHVVDGATAVVRAQVGYSDALLDLRQPLEASVNWYGDRARWTSGRARLLYGDDIRRRSVDAFTYTAAGFEEMYERNRRAYENFGDLLHIRANLCTPVVVGDQVLAVLNLDNFETSDAFDDSSLRIAEEFAVQAGVLLAASVRRRRDAERQRELEALVRVSHALHDIQTDTQAISILMREAQGLLGTPHIAFLHYDTVSDALMGVATSGMYEKHPLPPRQRGKGLAWAALVERQVLLVANTHRDPRVRLLPEEPPRALIAAPVITAAGDPLGVLLASSDETDAFSDSDRQILGAIALAGGTAMERVRTALAERRRAQELQVLGELSALAEDQDEPMALAEACLGRVRDALGADFATYFHPGRKVGVSVGTAPARFFEAADLYFETSESHVRELLSGRGRTVATARYETHPDAQPAFVEVGVRALVLVPVLEKGAMAGLMSVVWFHPVDDLPGAAEALLKRAADLVGRALERQDHIRELEGTREGALLSLGLALELRDFETAGHTERVVALSTALGQRMNLSADELEGLRQGAYLHDVGKLAVPDAILLKPGKLDPAEWVQMQAHARIGHDMTARVPTLHPLARLVIRHHHERWDGRGYPDGLRGTDIPRVARLFSVVDVYDALTSERPYKQAWTPADALLELRRMSGVQFDPFAVDAFCALMASTTAADGT